MRYIQAPRDNGYLVSDISEYFGISDEYCIKVIYAAGVCLRIWAYDTGKVIYGSLSPEEAKKVIHFFRLKKGMRLRA